MAALFGPSFTSDDRELMTFLASPDHESFLEGLWQKFRPYLKASQEAEFRDLEAQPHPRIWEMYLAIALSEQKFTLYKKLKEGPDIKLRDPTIWVEAIVSTDGAKGNKRIHAPSRVPEIVTMAPVYGGLPKTRSLKDSQRASKKRTISYRGTTMIAKANIIAGTLKKTS